MILEEKFAQFKQKMDELKILNQKKQKKQKAELKGMPLVV